MRRFWAFIVFGLMFAAMAAAQVPTSNHVVLLVEQNHSYSSVVGNKSMPYLNSLASKYGLATQYYANTHPSIGNYFEMTTGQLLTNRDNRTPASFPVSADNIVRQLMVAGKTWKSYAEGLPSVGYTGGDTGNYAVRHNPFAYFSDVQNSSVQKLNLVPFSTFATDLANGNLPNLSYIVPNVVNGGYSGTLQQADAWLQQNIAPLLANPAFQQDGILIITFDESSTSDTAHGGGQVTTLVIGPKVKAGYTSSTQYQHQNLLRTLLTALGVNSFPGAASSATPMDDLFASSSAPAAEVLAVSSGVTITSPASGATVSSPVKFVASARSNDSAHPITAMRIYVDNKSMYTVSAASINTSLSLAAGTHNVVIVAWDSSGKSYYKSESITVGSNAGSVTITSPVNGATVSSPVQFIASAKANSGNTITSMRIYVDNNSVYTVSAASFNTSLSLASGSHYVVIQAWDNTGALYKASENITVSSPTGTLSVTPSTLSFGSVNVGSSASQTVTVKANTAAVTLSQANVTGTGFSVSGVTLPTTIAAGQSVSLSLKFAPTAAGSATGTLSLVSNASNSTATVGLSGTGATVAGSVSVTPTSLSFGSMNVGSSTSQTVTVKASTAAVTLSKATVSGTGFSVSGLTLPVTISAGQSVSLSVKYAPTAAGAVSGSLSLVSNASNSTVTVPLSGTGVTVAGSMSVSPTALSFGSVNVGSSTSQNVTVSASTASVTLSQANVSGTGFSVSGLTLPVTISAGQSVSFSVKFAPAAAGTVSGSLSLISNASNSTSTVTLSGTGVSVAPQPHSVKLNWTASTSANITGYNVYRGTQAGTYTKISSATVSGTTYTDSSVSAGTTYYYVVTAVNSTGTESGYSSSVTAVIPTP